MEGPALKAMVRAGAAAGISAGFRSPAGAVLLTLEVFGARFNRELVAIGVAAGASYLTFTTLAGDRYLVHLSGPLQPIPWAGLLLVAPLMGLTAAPVGHLFLRLLAWAKTVLGQWPRAARVGLGGFLVGCIGIYYPQVMSAGYPVVETALKGEIGVRLLVTLLMLKILATAITFGLGAVGGMFAPALVMGAMFGGAFGFGVRQLYPGAAPQPEVFVLLGMVVMYAAIVKGCWSGLLLVADMSGSYHALLLPGILAGGISFLLSWAIHDRSVFDLPLETGRLPEAVVEPVSQLA